LTKFENTSFDDLSKKSNNKTPSLCYHLFMRAGFLVFMATKTKYRNRLNVEPDLHILLSQIEPDTAKLSKNNQPQISH